MNNIAFLFIVFFLFVTRGVIAQTGFVVTYKVQFRVNNEQVVPYEENRELMIFGNKSYFELMPDSEFLDVPIFPEPYSLMKDYKHGILLFRGAIWSDKFYSQENIPHLDWNMVDGDSVVCGYPCMKALARFRGRVWTAWYTLDLPYDDGPWKLGGLPGLILKAVESKGDFAFTAFKIKKQQIAVKNFSIKGRKKVSPQEYDKLLTEINERDSESGSRIIVNGKELKLEKRTPCLMEIFDDVK